MAKDKTLHGKPVTNHEFKLAIVDAFERYSAMNVASLVSVVGPEWDTVAGKRLLTSTLINMANRGAIRRVADSRGMYELSPGFARRGVSAFHQNEDAILDVIRENGGFARFSQIMEAFGCRPSGSDLRRLMMLRQRADRGELTEDDLRGAHALEDARDSSEYRGLVTTMAKSTRIRQDFLLKGWYNLPITELRNIPLKGRFLSLIVKATHLDLGPTRFTWMQARDDYFSRVGAVVNEARLRRKLTIEELVAIPKVQAALLQLSTVSAVRAELDQWYVAETNHRAGQLADSGTDVDVIGRYRTERAAKQREGSWVLPELITRFEAGGEELYGVNVHLNAPTSFYVALAEALEICPVAMSRGMLQMPTPEERLRPTL